MLTRLGKIEQQILKHLALHPRENMQVIQRALGIPEENYPSVRHAMKSLEKLGLVKSEPTISEKHVAISNWLLADDGLLIILKDAAEISREEFDLIFDNYVTDQRQRDFMKMVHAELGTSLMVKFMTGFLAVTSLDKNEKPEMVETVAAVSLMRVMKELSKEDKDRVQKLMERFMSTRMGVKGKILLVAFKKVGML
jgi:DNA-binding Lrp family transcriptional regulator